MTQYDPFAAQLFIGNEYVSSDQNVRDVINPSTLQQCGRIADATPAENRPRACLNGEGTWPAAVIVSFVLEAFYAAFSAVVAAVFYYELRVAKDGVDIDKIASVFD